ncbi:MAG: VanZ family protein [Pseudoflavonifractor sp.]|nr:VanZ family protein [Pseudoflavonifractor sp.]
MKFHPLSLPHYLPTALVAGLILYLTLAPNPLPDTDIPLFDGADKVVHAVMMLALMLTMSFDYARQQYDTAVSRLSTGVYTVICAITVLFGGATEVIQYLMGMGRSADVADFLADTAGALVGLIIAPRVTTKFIRFLRRF